MAGAHAQGEARRGIRAAVDEDLATVQQQQALLLVETYIHCAVGVQVQLRAIGQRHVAAFTHGGAVIGAQARPGRQVAGQPQGGAADHGRRQQLQGLAATQALGRGFQGLHHGAGAGHGFQRAGQFVVQHLHALPGLFVVLVGGSPVFAGALQLGITAGRAQAHQPVDGLAHHLRIGLGRGAHSAKRSW